MSRDAMHDNEGKDREDLKRPYTTFAKFKIALMDISGFYTETPRKHKYMLTFIDLLHDIQKPL
jgi:inner membrane protein involved in colicin E2 resistance